MKIIFLPAILILLLAACAPVYKPPLANPALFDKPGQIQGLLSYGTGGLNAGVAVSATDNIFLGGGGFFYTQLNDFNTPLLNRDQNFYGEFYLGYYTTIGTVGRFNLAGGIGSGSGRASDNFWSGITFQRGKYIRGFLQPNIAIASDFFDLGFAPRIAYVTFNEFTSDPISTGKLNSFFIEPIGYMNIGIDYVKLSLQGGLSLSTETENFIAFNYNPFIFGIGLTFMIKNRDLVE